MKKTILLIITASFIFCNANSQITKGNWMVGGSAGFSYTNNNSGAYSIYKNTNFSLSSNIGYFIWDKFCTGIKLSINSSKTDYPSNSNGSISYGGKSRFYNLGSFARYYFLDKEKFANIFIEGIYQRQIYSYVAPNITTQENADVFTINAGPVIYLNSSVGIELTVGYSSVKYVGSTGRNNTIQTSLGFQIHLEKDK